MFSYGENLTEGIEDYNRIKHHLYQHIYAIRPEIFLYNPQLSVE